MKKFRNSVLKNLDGTDSKTPGAKDPVPFTVKQALVTQFTVDNSTGLAAIKMYHLGLKICEVGDSDEFITVEDAEFELLQKLIRPERGRELWNSIAYGQLELIFKDAEDFKLDQKTGE